MKPTQRKADKPARRTTAHHSGAVREARLAVNLPLDVHRALKARAAEEGRTMRELILNLLARHGIGSGAR